MKVMINLGTADVEMQRSDGTWEKVDHCRTRVSVDAAVLKLELAAVLVGEPMAEVRELMGNAGAAEVDNKQVIARPRSVRPEPKA